MAAPSVFLTMKYLGCTVWANLKICTLEESSHKWPQSEKHFPSIFSIWQFLFIEAANSPRLFSVLSENTLFFTALEWKMVYIVPFLCSYRSLYMSPFKPVMKILSCFVQNCKNRNRSANLKTLPNYKICTARFFRDEDMCVCFGLS